LCDGFDTAALRSEWTPTRSPVNRVAVLEPRPSCGPDGSGCLAIGMEPEPSAGTALLSYPQTAAGNLALQVLVDVSGDPLDLGEVVQIGALRRDQVPVVTLELTKPGPDMSLRAMIYDQGQLRAMKTFAKAAMSYECFELAWVDGAAAVHHETSEVLGVAGL